MSDLTFPSPISDEPPVMEPTDETSSGNLKIIVTSALGPIPVIGALVIISYNNEPDRIIEELTTDRKSVV